MKRTLVSTLGVLCVAAITSCVAVPVGGEMDVYPPDAYIATATPMYFEGRAAYWYGGRWCYRDGGGWHAWREEPGHLREARVRAEPARQYYGRAHAGGYRHR
jgi:hypothetical protein